MRILQFSSVAITTYAAMILSSSELLAQKSNVTGSGTFEQSNELLAKQSLAVGNSVIEKKFGSFVSPSYGGSRAAVTKYFSDKDGMVHGVHNNILRINGDFALYFKDYEVPKHYSSMSGNTEAITKNSFIVKLKGPKGWVKEGLRENSMLAYAQNAPVTSKTQAFDFSASEFHFFYNTEVTDNTQIIAYADVDGLPSTNTATLVVRQTAAPSPTKLQAKAKVAVGDIIMAYKCKVENGLPVAGSVVQLSDCNTPMPTESPVATDKQQVLLSAFDEAIKELTIKGIAQREKATQMAIDKGLN